MKDYDLSVNFLLSNIPYVPKTALVLGSGFSMYASYISIDYEINYADVPGFTIPTNELHYGKLIIGKVNENKVLVMQGRTHYYEGYDMAEVIYPIRVFKLLGIRNLILTNASGGIHVEYRPGSLVLVKDHISSFVPNCLRGKNDPRIGLRFPDSTDIYSKKVRKDIIDRCAKVGITLQEGVYIHTAGPSFETPAEIRAYGILGADIVGMSTTCEAIAASHAGMNVCCLSCVSNYASGITVNKLSIEEVNDTVNEIFPQLQTTVNNIIDYFSYEEI